MAVASLDTHLPVDPAEGISKLSFEIGQRRNLPTDSRLALSIDAARSLVPIESRNRLHGNDEIAADEAGLEAVSEHLTNQAFPTISGHCVADLPADGEPEPRGLQSVPPRKDDQVPSPRLESTLHHRVEITRQEDPAGLGKTPIHGTGYLPGVVGARIARPLARRLERTLRPLLVAILALKPWVRSRLIRLGW